MSFPKKGKFFPRENGYNGKAEQPTNGGFVEEIAAALKRSLGDSRAGVKTVAAWTGANEKTVKKTGEVNLMREEEGNFVMDLRVMPAALMNQAANNPAGFRWQS